MSFPTAIRITLFLAFSALLPACRTSPSTPVNEPTPIPVAQQVDHSRKKIEWEIEQGPAGLAVRHLGSTSTGGIVLMNGLENIPAGPYKMKDKHFSTIVEEIAQDIGCEVEAAAGYYFLYPSTYQVLTAVSLPTELHSTFEDMNVTAAFGADTPLYSALALLSRGLKTTLVADNAIAESPIGELSLTNIPLPQALEALLKSARVQAGAFGVSSSKEFVFLHSARNGPSRRLHTSADALTPLQRRILNKKVSIALPVAAGGELATSATPLGDVLDSLSRQLGVRVQAQSGMESFPVNPVVMTDMRVESAMDLLVRQWLRPEYGYELTETGILIRRTSPPTAR